MTDVNKIGQSDMKEDNMGSESSYRGDIWPKPWMKKEDSHLELGRGAQVQSLCWKHQTKGKMSEG